MNRIIIGPSAIKREGLDRVTKSVVKEIRKLSKEEHCEILFLMDISNEDISYMLRHILRILDTALTIITRIDLEYVNKTEDKLGNELALTMKFT